MSRKEYLKNYYKINKQAYFGRTKKVYDYNSKLISRWKIFKGCEICGYNKHPHALDLDHISDNSTKPKSLHAIRYNWSKSRIKKELSKCQVLCSNCHREKTANDK